MRIYTLKPGTVKEYKKCFNEIGYPIISKYLNLVGFWYTEVGNLNQMVSIWAYESLDKRTELRQALYQDPEWNTEFMPRVTPLFLSMENRIMLGLDCSPLK
jgi:hypothetical protein